jgi:hypothetical protein
MKKRILFLSVLFRRLFSKSKLKPDFLLKLQGAFRETYKAVLWVCVGVSFTLALQVNAFSDVHPQDWFAPHVQKFQEMGVIQGEGLTGNFAPEREANRAEIAKMFSVYDEAMRADFSNQLESIRAQILAEVSRDMEVKTYSFKNELERKIDSESKIQSSSLSLLAIKAGNLESSLADIDKNLDATDQIIPREPVAVSVASPTAQAVLNLSVPADAVSKLILVKQGSPTNCPTTWSQSGYDAKWANGLLYYQRTCVTDDVCSVRYYQGTAESLSACESGAKQADYWYLGKNNDGNALFRRACYSCE